MLFTDSHIEERDQPIKVSKARIVVYAEKKPNGDIYITRSDGTFFACYPWHYSDKPDRRNKYIILNCNKYRLVWGKPHA